MGYPKRPMPSGRIDPIPVFDAYRRAPQSTVDWSVTGPFAVTLAAFTVVIAIITLL